MPETITIPKEEYEELVRYRYIDEGKKNKFNFDEVFGIGSGKLKGQEVKDELREEW